MNIRSMIETSGMLRGISRRTFVGGILSGCVFCSGGVALAKPQPPRFCAVDRNALKWLRPRSSTGNAQLDRVLIAELRNIIRVIPVKPGFRIVDDFQGPNAFATSESLVHDTKGTALFGINLIRTELRHKNGGYAVAGIAAHECAHIFQFLSRYFGVLTHGQPTAKRLELHADLLAGYYLAKDKASEINLEAFARSLFEKGDYAFNDRNHHGTPDERVSAMERGYALAREPFHRVAELGIRHVL